jgi:hypothetical protein
MAGAGIYRASCREVDVARGRKSLPRSLIRRVEPVWANRNAGRLNCAVNGLRATFMGGYVGARHRRRASQPPIDAVDAPIQSLSPAKRSHLDLQIY